MTIARYADLICDAGGCAKNYRRRPTNSADPWYVWVRGDQLPQFVEMVAPKLLRRYILVSGSDDRGPLRMLGETGLVGILNSTRLVHWFAEAADFVHPKLDAVPTGLWPRHITQALRLHELRERRVLTPIERPLTVLCAFRVESNHPSRLAAERFCQASSLADATLMQSGRQPQGALDPQAYQSMRNATHDAMARHAFVLCPLGVGLGSHRFTEALLLGSIPIVFRSTLDAMYESMGVAAVINHVDEITEANLKDWVARFNPQFESRTGAPQATQAYWHARIFSARNLSANRSDIDTGIAKIK